jgi:glycosyl transferase family 25
MNILLLSTGVAKGKYADDRRLASCYSSDASTPLICGCHISSLQVKFIALSTSHSCRRFAVIEIQPNTCISSAAHFIQAFDRMTVSASKKMTRNQPAPLFCSFDRIRIINLAHRTDRRAEMTRQLKQVGLDTDPRVEFFPALTANEAGFFYSSGSHGNFLSYTTILSDAAAAGESVLVLEDDCDFLLPSIFDYQIPEQWDIFYGGYIASDPDNLPKSDIIGAHFMGFSAQAAVAATHYFSRYLEADFPVDAHAAAQPGFNPAIRAPIDGAFVWFRRAHPELVTVFQMLGVQRPSRTDIGENRFYDRVPGLRSFIDMARRMRARFSTNKGRMTKAGFGAKQ